MKKAIPTDFQTFVKFWLVPLVIIGALFVIYKAVAGLIIIGISIFLALALKPLVNKVNDLFSKMFGSAGKHQTASAILAYLIVVVVIGGILAIIGPVVINETSKFIKQFPATFQETFGGWDGINHLGQRIGIENLQAEITNYISKISNDLLATFGSNLVASISGIADVVMKIVLVLVLTLLFLLEGPTLMDTFWKSVGAGRENKKPVKVAQDIVSKMATVVSTYVSNQLTVAILDGIASGLITFVLTLIFGLSPTLALPMGLITMIFYMIPMFGQFIGGTLVTALLFFSNPLASIIFAIIYIIYAQIENNIISPKIQGNSLKLPAVVILCAIVIGMYMFGLLGAIIAIPIAGCIRVLIDEYPKIRAAND